MQQPDEPEDVPPDPQIGPPGPSEQPPNVIGDERLEDRLDHDENRGRTYEEMRRTDLLLLGLFALCFLLLLALLVAGFFVLRRITSR